MIRAEAPATRLIPVIGADDPAIAPRPFVKWAGGKRQLLPSLRAWAPKSYGSYFEPFVGGGAFFFALHPESAVLADANERLIRSYRGVRDDVDGVIERLRTYRNESAFFYEIREVDIDSKSDADVAAWFIYLNRVGYNGLYRVNRDNRFNVPFGRHRNPKICDERTLRASSRALRSADLVNGDFEAAVSNAKKGDFVYFDPPYAPLSPTSSFTSYTSGGFGDEQQIRLRDVALRLKRLGVSVLISNSSAPLVKEIYAKGFKCKEVEATRMVNSKAAQRGKIIELVIR